MPLQKISDFDANYTEAFEGKDLKGMGVYTQTSEEKIGTVDDILVDEQGQIRYIIVDLGFWIFGKKVLLPVGRSEVDYKAARIHATGMTRQQAEALPEFSDRLALDYDYEEKVRGVYRQDSTPTAATADTVAAAASQPTHNRDTYTYDQDAALYDTSKSDNQNFKLYQERLIANKTRAKTGEVAVGKRVETETAKVSVPVEKERVVIERVTPADAGKAVAPGSVNFSEGEVARVEIYEETADIHKEAFVREEVKVKKVVDKETVEAQETLRREELDVNVDGRSIVDDSTKK